MTKQAEKLFKENIDQSLNIDKYNINRLLNKLAHIYRWNQDTTRLFSVLNHSLIMVDLVERFYPQREIGRNRNSILCAMALTHDINEAILLGDIKTWQKKVYLNSTYTNHVQQFDKKIKTILTGILSDFVDMPALSKIIKELDTVMLAAEFLTITDNSVKSDANIKKALTVADPDKVKFAIDCLLMDTVASTNLLTRANYVISNHFSYLECADLPKNKEEEKETPEVRKAT